MTTTMAIMSTITAMIMTTESGTAVRSGSLLLCPGNADVCIKVPELQISLGNRWVITGPSGCGKSSLLNALSGLLPPAGGTLRVLGRDLYAMKSGERDRFRGKEMGMVHQNFHLMSGFTALENVTISLRYSAGITGTPAKQRALDTLENAGLSHRLHTRVERLSRGEAQRVALARALAPQPRLLLSDEPTGSLDPARSAEMMWLMTELWERAGCAWICVTHDANLASGFENRIDARDWIQGEVAR